MNEQRDHDDVRQALQDILPPIDTELRRDLWPMMQGRLRVQKPRVVWYDWALAGVVGGAIVAFPGLFLVLVYHL